MSYICEFCGLRPENCGCPIDLTEPRLESELVFADNIMAVENPNIKKSYGLFDAPSPDAFFSLLSELENESKYDTPPSTPISINNLFPVPKKLERQSSPPPKEELKDIAVDLFTEKQQLPSETSIEIHLAFRF